MEHAVAFIIGLTALPVGLSLIFHWEAWSAWLKSVRVIGKPAALIIGYVHLLIGTFIVSFHWKWEGLPLLLTLLGIKAILEGFIYTLSPGTMLSMLKWYEPHHRKVLRISGAITVVIGVLVLQEWLQALPQT